MNLSKKNRTPHKRNDVLVKYVLVNISNIGMSFQLIYPSINMGKKSRVKIQKSSSGATVMVSPKEMMNLVSELLQSKFTITISANTVLCGE